MSKVFVTLFVILMIIAQFAFSTLISLRLEFAVLYDEDGTLAGVAGIIMATIMAATCLFSTMFIYSCFPNKAIVTLSSFITLSLVLIYAVIRIFKLKGYWILPIFIIWHVLFTGWLDKGDYMKYLGTEYMTQEQIQVPSEVESRGSKCQVKM